MKITLNLASEPYIDLRSILKRLRILMAALAALSILLWLLFHAEQKSAAIATARVDAMQKNVLRLQQQQQSYVSLMRQPRNAAVLAQSEFLNGLFRSKAFSWTATMTDLETVLPAGVQVLSLDPEISKSGEVILRLRVSGAHDRAVDLLRNLEKSRHFANPRLAGEALAQAAGSVNNVPQPISASSLVNFEIISDYRPLTAEEMKAAQAKEPEKHAENAPGTAPLTINHAEKRRTR